MSNKDIITKVDKGYRMERPTDGPLSCPENFYEVMTICWNKEPRNRPTFLYLQSVFDTMYQSEVEEEEYNSRSQRIKRNKNAVDDMNQQCTNPAKRNKNSVVSCKTLTVTECTSKLKVQSIQQMCNTLRPSVSHAGS